MCAAHPQATIVAIHTRSTQLVATPQRCRLLAVKARQSDCQRLFQDTGGGGFGATGNGGERDIVSGRRLEHSFQARNLAEIRLPRARKHEKRTPDHSAPIMS